MNTARERSEVARRIEALAIRTPTPDQPASLLSGGNQQKVVFARWSFKKPKVYVLDEPTQGVDVATKLDLYRLIRASADDGSAIVLISSDLLELIGMADRILVFSRGALVEEVRGAGATEERIVGSAVKHSGGPREPAPAARRRGGARNRDGVIGH